MRLHLLCLFSVSTLLFCGLNARAEDTKHTYTGEITGVTCSACKQDVQTALLKNLPGALSIVIERGEKEGVQKLTIVSKDAKEVTASDANKALGKDAEDFKIVSLKAKE